MNRRRRSTNVCSSRLARTGAGLALLVCGCTSQRTSAPADGPDMAAFLELITPRTIEIQPYLTKPHSFDGSGDANGVEVLLATRDALGDEVKCVGTFNFELFAHRPASGDPYGQRFGVWTLSVNTARLLQQYWDRPSKYYKFPLEIDGGPLPPGKYILTAQFVGPAGNKLFDEYTFVHSSSAGAQSRRGRVDAADRAKR